MMEFGQDIAHHSWNRMAEPQEDRYDTRIVVELARRRFGERMEVGDRPTFFDGKVALDNEPFSRVFPDHCTPAPFDHPNIQKACDLVRMWPAVFGQFQCIIDCVGVFLDIDCPEDRVLGSRSHHPGFGKVASTINNHVGFAQSLVREMAHHKLRALGVDMETADRIIKNARGQLFMSPIRHDRRRPMSAVLHDQYSNTHVASLNILIIKAASDPARDLVIAEGQLSSLLPKLEFGSKIVEDNAVTDDIGSAFLEGYFAWLKRVLEEGFALLDDLKLSPVSFVHPLDLRAVRPRRREKVSEFDVLDEKLLYFSGKELGATLNSSARAVWDLCDGTHTIDEIVGELGRRFGCTDTPMLSALDSDVKTILDKLHDLGLMNGALPE